MGIRDDQREKVVDLLSAHLLETGLSQTSLRQLAAAAGVSDRMLLYYFSDKADVLTAAMARLAGELAMRLGSALPEQERLLPADLVLHATAFSTQPEMRRFMRLWIEVVAAAARNEVPFVSIAGQIASGFRLWVDARLDVPPGADRDAVASAVVAIVDGLALIDICDGNDMAPRMADALSLILGRNNK